MSFVSSTELDRLTGYKILPTPKGYDAYTLILETKYGEWACVADHRILLLAASLQKHATDPEQENS